MQSYQNSKKNLRRRMNFPEDKESRIYELGRFIKHEEHDLFIDQKLDLYGNSAYVLRTCNAEPHRIPTARDVQNLLIIYNELFDSHALIVSGVFEDDGDDDRSPETIFYLDFIEFKDIVFPLFLKGNQDCDKFFIQVNSKAYGDNIPVWLYGRIGNEPTALFWDDIKESIKMGVYVLSDEAEFTEAYAKTNNHYMREKSKHRKSA